MTPGTGIEQPAPAGPISSAGVAAAFERLQAAQQTQLPCPPIRDLLGDDAGVEAAYAVQRLVLERATGDGRRAVGRKVGLTSAAVQAQLHVDRPDFGTLFADMACSCDEEIAPERLMQPRIEAEIAFVLGADLDAEVTAATARSAVAYAVAALEIVDSRIADWDISLVDTIADNASCGLYVLGPEQIDVSSLDLRTVSMTMTDRTGTEVSAGTGADCLDDPILALAWLARTVRDLGDPLRAGEVVLSGALGPMVPVLPGSGFTAVLTRIGRVTANFAPQKSP